MEKWRSEKYIVYTYSFEGSRKIKIRRINSLC